MSENLGTIKKIRTNGGDFLIDASYLNGKSFEDLRGMVQGVVSTYVIPTSNEGKDGYDSVVNSGDNSIIISKTNLNSLIKPENTSGEYKIGDIILMEATSDGTKVFDRWVSDINEDNITLTVLETQVATHHHTLGVNTGDAIVGAEPTFTSVIPTVGSEVTVLTGTSGTIVTSVNYDETDEGGHNFELSEASQDDNGSVGHSHIVNSHDHNVVFKPIDFVNQTVEVYNTLTSGNYTPHTHTTTSVAGAKEDQTAISYVYEGQTEEFIKTLKDSDEQNTGDVSLTTDSNVDGLEATTITLAGTDTIQDIKTTNNGEHTHNVSAVTTTDVVTDVTLAENVITSVTYVKPIVQPSVVTSVTTTPTEVLSSATAATTKENVVIAIVEDDVLILNPVEMVTGVTVDTTKVNVISEVTGNTATQSEGSLDTSSATQTHTSGKVTSTCETDAAGDHSHGFNHSHAIPTHTHSVASHNHTYVKSIADTKGNAYTSLSTETYVPHTHSDVTVVATATDGEAFEYISGGSKISVVQNLKENEQSYTSTSSAPETDTKYVKLTGDIDFPGLSIGTKELSTTTVTPAVAGTEKAIASISYTSGNFVTGVADKTSKNIGGE